MAKKKRGPNLIRCTSVNGDTFYFNSASIISVTNGAVDGIVEIGTITGAVYLIKAKLQDVVGAIGGEVRPASPIDESMELERNVMSLVDRTIKIRRPPFAQSQSAAEEADKPAFDLSKVTAGEYPDGIGDRVYVIEKAALWYLPERKGFSGDWRNAGLYTLDEALDITHPNGRKGSRDDMQFHHVRTASKNLDEYSMFGYDQSVRDMAARYQSGEYQVPQAVAAEEPEPLTLDSEKPVRWSVSPGDGWTFLPGGGEGAHVAVDPPPEPFRWVVMVGDRCIDYTSRELAERTHNTFFRAGDDTEVFPVYRHPPAPAPALDGVPPEIMAVVREVWDVGSENRPLGQYLSKNVTDHIQGFVVGSDRRHVASDVVKNLLLRVAEGKI